MLREIILEILEDLRWWSTDDVFLDLTSYKSLRRYSYYGGRPPKTKKEVEVEQQSKKRQRFYNLLYQLKKQGFIEKKNKGKRRGFWKLTSKGLQYLKNLKHKKRKNSTPFLKPKDSIKKDYLKVIVFDIPETKRKERKWLRNTLVNFDFSMLQKSVWIGETQLPEDFFHALKELDLLPYIHIFAVNKEKPGTLYL